jgi:DNA-binding IclR family transcriptional regulator
MRRCAGTELLELGEAQVDELAQRTGAAAVELAASLDRLIDLGYAERHEEGGTVYRSVARTL